MFGSGQWTVWEGYAAVKLMKAGFRSNNLDPNARHCMASAAVGFMRTFGMDEPMGCYDDIEQADAFVLWGSNMAEMHPILWQRMSDRKLSAPNVTVNVLSTYEHRSFELADLPIVFTPQTDIAILNYIANYIIQKGAVNRDFINKHVNFKLGNADIGYGLRPEHPLQKAAKNAGDVGGSKPMNFDEFTRFVSKYDADSTSKLTGVPKDKLERLAALCRPQGQGDVLLDDGVNQHTRGVWANHLIYNIHLLTGKIATPGNSPFSLTGQPSACGTARGRHLAHRLPADMVVTNPKHRQTVEQSWKLPPAPSRTSPATTRCCKAACLPTASSIATGRRPPTTCRRGQPQPRRHPGFRNPANFIVVSESTDVTSPAADLILPAAMWVERKAPSATPNAAPTSGTSWWTRREARSDLWQMMEFSKRFRMEEVWPKELLDQKPEYRGKTLFEVLFRNGQVDQFPLAQTDTTYNNFEAKHFGFYVQKACSRNTRLRPRPATTWRLRRVPQGARAALAGGERQGDPLALQGRHRPLREGGHGHQFYGNPDGKANVFAFPYEPAAGRRTRTFRCGWSPAVCWNTGIRVP